MENKQKPQTNQEQEQDNVAKSLPVVEAFGPVSRAHSIATQKSYLV